MRLTLLLLAVFTEILTSAYSAGLTEEFTWTKITYRWPKPGPSKRQTHLESRGRGRGRFRFTTENPDAIVFEDESSATNFEKKMEQQEFVPKFIDYRVGKFKKSLRSVCSYCFITNSASCEI